MVANQRHCWTLAALALFLSQVTNAALALHLHQVSGHHICQLDATRSSTPASPNTPERHRSGKHRHDEAHCPFCTMVFKVVGKYTSPPVEAGSDVLMPIRTVTACVCQPPRHVSKRPWSARPPPGDLHFLAIL